MGWGELLDRGSTETGLMGWMMVLLWTTDQWPGVVDCGCPEA